MPFFVVDFVPIFLLDIGLAAMLRMIGHDYYIALESRFTHYKVES